MPVTIARKKAIETIETAGADQDGKYLRANFIQILYIQYSITFWKNSVLALINSSSEINNIQLTFTEELDLSIRPTDIGALNINSTILNINRMIFAAFLIIDKAV